MPRQIVIGDIHGCYDELQMLLDRVGPGADDEIIAVGDLINRGPAAEKVLRFFQDTPNAFTVRGNHEETHLQAARGDSPLFNADRMTQRELGHDYAAWLDFMAAMPTRLERESAYIVHGLFEPGVSFAEQRDDVLMGYFTGEKYLREKIGKEWYEHYDGDKPLIVGHHHYRRDGQPLIIEDRVYAIDTGCTHGWRLTAVILPAFDIVSVRSRKNYWAQMAAAAGIAEQGDRPKG